MPVSGISFWNRKDIPPQNLTNSAVRESYPRFSPVDNKIAFVENGIDSLYIKILNLDNHQIETLLPLPKLNEINYTIYGMDWSPDGRQIAYAIKSTATETVQIFIMDLASGFNKPLFANPKRAFRERYPAFSPDGQYLAFARTTEKGADDIMMIQLQSGEMTQLTNSDENIRGLDWDPVQDNRIVYFAEKNGVYTLKQIEIQGQMTTLFTPFSSGAVCLNPQFNASGDLLSYENITFSTNIYSAFPWC